MDNKFVYSKLEWDSEFFSFDVGRIHGKLKAKENGKNFIEIVKSNNARLIYYSSELKLEFSIINKIIGSIKLVDLKTTFLKILPDCKRIIQPLIFSYNKDYPEEKLIDLAIQSGEYSRFKVDKNIPDKKFKELYKLWIVNSVNRKFANEVLVYRVSNKIAGFVTLIEEDGVGSIGIIAVDKDQRGKGIGKILMNSAEYWFWNNNIRTIKVITQGENLPACMLYEKFGYHKIKQEYFYHIWKGEN